MSNKNLGILAIVAAFMVIVAAVLSGLSESVPKGSTGPTYLIQGLADASIGRIVVGSGDDAVTLRKSGRSFRVAEKSDYPADIKQINELIRNCADIKTAGSATTSNPKNHADLEVTEDKGASVVKFFTPDPNSELITGVIIGKNVEAGQGKYVRRLPQNEVYVTTESPWIRDQATDYIDQDLVSVKREDINSVTVNPGGETYTLKAGEGDSVSLANLPAGKKLKNTDARSVVTALTDLRFDDVRRTGSLGGAAFDRQYVCTLDNQVVYTLSLAEKDEKIYALCAARYTGEEPKKERKVESEEELKKKEAKLLAMEEARNFSTKHSGWVYEIPEWKAKNLTKKLSELLEDVEKPKDPNTPAEPPTPKPTEKATAPKVTQTPAPKPVEAEKPAPKAVEIEKPASAESGEKEAVAPDGAKVDDPNAPKK